MQIDVTELRKTVGATEEHRFAELMEPLSAMSERIPFAGPVVLDVKLTNTKEVVVATGDLSAVVTLRCGRCLRPFDYPVRLEFVEEFRQVDDGPGGARREEAVDWCNYEGDVIDLTESVRSAILLALPMKPVCDEDCRGLCPVCGVNLNERRCDCAVDAGDPRLFKLRDLLDRGK